MRLHAPIFWYGALNACIMCGNTCNTLPCGALSLESSKDKVLKKNEEINIDEHY
jgi:hypothetical protein